MELIVSAAATNWDTFAPDMIVGVTTGVVVGAVLLVAQGITQSRSSRSASQFAWESLKPKLRGAAFRGWERDLNSLAALPPALVALDEIASSEPLALWKSHLKKPDEALDLLMALLQLRPQFESNSTAVELALSPFEGGLKGFYSGRFVRARAYGQPDSRVRFLSITLADSGLDDEDAAIYSGYADAIVADTYMGIQFGMYQSTVAEYDKLMARFQEKLQSDRNS